LIDYTFSHLILLFSSFIELYCSKRKQMIILSFFHQALKSLIVNNQMNL